MNARDNANLVHLMIQEPRAHAANPEHLVQMGLTECLHNFTWKTGPHYFNDKSDKRFVPTPDAPTCIRCLWEKDN